MKAVAYVRVSSAEQAVQGVSLSAQERAVRAYATAQGLELERIYRDEGQSAGSLNRPGLRAMLERVSAGGIGAVVVWKLDRLTRRQRHLLNMLELELEPAGCALKSVTESFDTGTPAGRAMLAMLGAFAELERAQLRERTRAGLEQVKAEGRHVGRVPFGYQLRAGGKRGELEPCEREQAVLSMARYLRESGHSLRQVARVLNRGKQFTRSGREWTHRSLAYVLQAETGRAAA